MNEELPFSPAAFRNREVILSELKDIFKDAKEVIELGHGTGEHALFFSEHMPWLEWYPFDTKDYNWILAEKRKEVSFSNLKDPKSFQVTDTGIQSELPKIISNIYCANVFHIMYFKHVEMTLKELNQKVKKQIILYGPYKFDGEFTSESNAQFHQSLQERDPQMGIRDFEEVQALLDQFELVQNKAMPANNNLLIFKRRK